MVVTRWRRWPAARAFVCALCPSLRPTLRVASRAEVCLFLGALACAAPRASAGRAAMAPTKLIIDTDPGVDDALAIFMAFNSPEARSWRRNLRSTRVRRAHSTPNRWSCSA